MNSASATPPAELSVTIDPVMMARLQAQAERFESSAGKLVTTGLEYLLEQLETGRLRFRKRQNPATVERRAAA